MISGFQVGLDFLKRLLDQIRRIYFQTIGIYRLGEIQEVGYGMIKRWPKTERLWIVSIKPSRK